MREITVVFDPERKLFLYFAVLFLAIGVGPFGTYEALNFWQRVVFWSLDVVGGMAIIVPIMHVFYASALVRFLPSLARLLAGTMLGALPGAGYISVLYSSVGGNLEINVPFPLLFFQVTVFSMVLFLTEFIVWPLMVRHRKDPTEVREAPAIAVSQAEPAPGQGVQTAPIGEALLRRLPADMRGAEIESVSMQDHYAHVATSKGEALLLIRLSDVMELLADVPGAQIHRSHWVASAQVCGIHRDGRKFEVELVSGRRLPVGAKFLDNARRMLPD